MIYWHNLNIFLLHNIKIIKIVDSEDRHTIGTGNWGCCSDICPREYAGNFLAFIASATKVG